MKHRLGMILECHQHRLILLIGLRDGKIQKKNEKRRLLWMHYVEIPAVQAQQQSPSVGNAKKKKVHIYVYTS